MEAGHALKTLDRRLSKAVYKPSRVLIVGDVATHRLALRTDPFALEANGRVLGQLPEKCAQTEAMCLGFHFQRGSDLIVQPD
jgi:hypothetical protein